MKAWMSSNLPDTTTDSGVICPWASEKLIYDVVNTLMLSFLIGCSSFLQVTRTIIKSRTKSKFGKIELRTAEIDAVERLETPIDFSREKCRYTQAPSFLIESSSF